MNLRPYQQRVMSEINTWFTENPEGNPIVSVATGGGKSLIIAEFCRKAVLDYPGYRSRILMLVPSKELLLQNADKLTPYLTDIYVGIVSASIGRKDTAFDKDLVIATVGSVTRNPGQLGRIDIVIIDECHNINRKMTGQYRKLIADIQRFNPACRALGLTATPFRGNGVWLTEGKERLFTDIASRVTLRELLDSGFLSPLSLAETDIHVDASKVRMNGGDFVVNELAKVLDNDELTERIARQIVELGKDRKKWLVYCVNVAHAEHMNAHINALGVQSRMVCALTPAKERDQIIGDLKRGVIQCVCNVAVLTTGFDLPELDLIALVRNTRSPVLYCQIAGRGMRIHEDKTDCLWLDFTDTTAVLGPVDQIKGRSEPKPTKPEDREAPIKTCPECGSQCGIGSKECKTCGFEFPENEINVNHYISNANILTKISFNTYEVSRVTYSKHINQRKPGAPPTLKVSYWSHFRLILSEYVCFEHEGFVKERAKQWWHKRNNNTFFNDAPVTVDSALQTADHLTRPQSIVVKEGEQWPELIRCIFSDELQQQKAG